MDGFDILDTEDIYSGRATDAYFLRTEEILEAKNINPKVVADIGEKVDNWSVLAGLKDVAELLEGIPVDLYSLPEGTFFKEEPIMRIEGDYLDFCRFETSILGFICKASGVASSAMQITAASGDIPAISFGTRRQPPSIAPLIERSALIGGMDGISHVAAGDEIGVKAGGTMPHALVISMRSQEKAWRAYNDVMDPEIPRVMLCDTYSDEKDEVVRAAEELGEDLDSVRLDTTSSRRGDMREIVEEVRWELDLRGYEDVGIFVSGGIGVEEIKDLKDVVDGFGVGGSVANASPIDFSLDIIEVDGEPAGKRGEKSGKKTIRRDNFDDEVVLEDEVEEREDLLEPVIQNGDVVMDFSIDSARQRVLKSIDELKDRNKLSFLLD